MVAPRAPFRYWGSKVQMAPWIVDRLPAHDHFIEACCGSAAVMAVKPPVAGETLNDLYGEIVNFFRVLQTPALAARLIDRVAFTPYSLAEFQLALEILREPETGEPDVVRAWAFFVSMQMAVVPGRTAWSYCTAGATFRKANKPGRWATMPDLLIACAARFDRVQIEQRDVIDLIQRYDAPGVLIFVDPPYTDESRPTSTGASSAYVLDAFDHVAFLAAVNAAEHATFAIVHYPDPLYDDAGFVHAGDFESHRNIPNGDSRDVQVERLYLAGPDSSLLVPAPALYTPGLFG